MTEAIQVAFVTGGLSLLGTVITIILTSRKQQEEMDKQIAIMNTKMEDMREDIKTHNQYAKMFSENIPAIKQHMADVDRLIRVLQRLAETGNSVLVIEHNLDVIKTADYIIDLGPEGGDEGGKVIATGTPEEVAKNKKSFTGAYVAPFLKRDKVKKR